MDLPKDLEKYRLPPDQGIVCPKCGHPVTHLMAKRHQGGLMFAFIHDQYDMSRAPCFTTVDEQAIEDSLARVLKPAPGIH